MASRTKIEKKTQDVSSESNTMINEMINLHMTYMKSVRFPLLAAYFEEKGIDVSLQELLDLFPEGESIRTPAKKESPTDTCKRIMDEKSKKPGEECGGNCWKNKSGQVAYMCKRCMDLKCGRELATKLAERLNVDLEVVTADYDFPKLTGDKPVSSRGRGTARGRGSAPRGRGRVRVNVVNKLKDFKEGKSSDEDGDDTREPSVQEETDSGDESETSQEESEEEVKKSKRTVKIVRNRK